MFDACLNCSSAVKPCDVVDVGLGFLLEVFVWRCSLFSPLFLYADAYLSSTPRRLKVCSPLTARSNTNIPQIDSTTTQSGISTRVRPDPDSGGNRPRARSSGPYPAASLPAHPTLSTEYVLASSSHGVLPAGSQDSLPARTSNSIIVRILQAVHVRLVMIG